MRRSFCLLAVLAGVSTLSLPTVMAADSKRPNVILIMADDLGFECIGANGCEDYKTPVAILQGIELSRHLEHAVAGEDYDGDVQCPQLRKIRCAGSVAKNVRPRLQEGWIHHLHRGQVATG